MREETYQIFFEYIRTALASKDRAAARKAAQYTVEKFPGESEAWLFLAGLSDPEESLEYIRRAKEISPDDPRVLQAEVWAKNRLEKASQEKAIQEESIQFFLGYINKCLRDNDISSADKAANFLIERYPEKVEGWLSRGWLSSLEVFVKSKEFVPDEIRIVDAESLVINEISKVQPIRPEPEAALPILAKEKEPELTSMSEPIITENRSLIWLWALLIILLCAITFLGIGLLPNLIGSWFPNRISRSLEMDIKPTLTQPVGNLSQMDVEEEVDPGLLVTPTPSPEPSPTPTLVPDLYGCEMSITFVSGPLMGQGTDFTMLDETYFEDKGDKFEPGKNTGLFYKEANHLILHSGFIGANIDMPLEIEFLRYFLEDWAHDDDPGFIEGQMRQLEGSEMVWRCDGQATLRLRLIDVVRLSHEASTRLWLEPLNIQDILDKREGDPDEWIGEIDEEIEPVVYLSFCGWGPRWVTQGRSVYYRYLFQFEIITGS